MLRTAVAYDTGGNRLISHNADGTTTAYLGLDEVVQTGTVLTDTRYYPNAERTAAGLNWTITDPHGTGELAINATTLAVTRRHLDPFGNPRNTTSTWPTNKTFLGDTQDPTGTTHIGAREYDSVVGRFTTLDPILERGDPQQLNGYSYAGNNPSTNSDPTGMVNAGDGSAQEFSFANGWQFQGDGNLGGAAFGAARGLLGASLGEMWSDVEVTGAVMIDWSKPLSADETKYLEGTDIGKQKIADDAGFAQETQELDRIKAADGQRSEPTKPEPTKPGPAKPEPTEPKTPSGPSSGGAGNFTAGGHSVTYSGTGTAVGSDSATLNNFTNVRNTGLHDVVAHGTSDGFISLDDEITNGGQLVDAVRANPNYVDGQPCRLIVCHSGTSGVGQQFADELGVPVLAPSNRVGTIPALGPGQEPIIDKGGSWGWLYPR